MLGTWASPYIFVLIELALFQPVFSSLAFYSMHTDALVNSMGYTNATLLGNPVSSLISGGIICGFHECLRGYRRNDRYDQTAL